MAEKKYCLKQAGMTRVPWYWTMQHFQIYCLTVKGGTITFAPLKACIQSENFRPLKLQTMLLPPLQTASVSCTKYMTVKLRRRNGAIKLLTLRVWKHVISLPFNTISFWNLLNNYKMFEFIIFIFKRVNLNILVHKS